MSSLTPTLGIKELVVSSSISVKSSSKKGKGKSKKIAIALKNPVITNRKIINGLCSVSRKGKKFNVQITNGVASIPKKTISLEKFKKILKETLNLKI